MPICLYTLLYLLSFLLPVNAHAQGNSLIAQMHAIESSLVDVRTVYARTLSTKGGRKGIASYERHGAGVIIDPSGIIVTNTHTIINAPRIFVALPNGKVYEASLLYASDADFSFLKINTPFKLKSIAWANSQKAQLGDSIATLGSSDLNDQTILGGEITSLIGSQSSGEIELIEVNINLYQGDSGAPILDQQGRLLGLIMGKQKTQDRKSYAIASNKIRREYLKYKQNLP